LIYQLPSPPLQLSACTQDGVLFTFTFQSAFGKGLPNTSPPTLN